MYNEVQPTVFNPPGRLVIIGDVHGDVQRFLHCLYATKIFNTRLEWIAEPRDTIVVQLGDQIDSQARANNTTEWENLADIEMIYLTDRLDHLARLGGGRVLSLIGNHELMNVEGEFSYVSNTSQQKLPLQRRRHMFRPGGSLARILSKRNILLKIGSKVFCHAGILPHHLIVVENQIHVINDVMRKYVKNTPLNEQETVILQSTILDAQGILWTRMYVELAEADQNVLQSAVENVLTRMNAKRIYTGHNTVPSVTSLADGRVLLTDIGLSRAYGTDRVQFLDILHPDTPEELTRMVQIQTTSSKNDMI